MKYDFSELESQENEDKLEEDPRENFRIEKVCGTCNYFYLNKSNSDRNGFCKLPNLKNAQLGSGRPIDSEIEAKGEGWPRTHSFARCDHHEIRNERTVRTIEEWVKRRFNFDGTLNEEMSREDFPNDT